MAISLWTWHLWNGYGFLRDSTTVTKPSPNPSTPGLHVFQDLSAMRFVQWHPRKHSQWSDIGVVIPVVPWNIKHGSLKHAQPNHTQYTPYSTRYSMIDTLDFGMKNVWLKCQCLVIDLWIWLCNKWNPSQDIRHGRPFPANTYNHSLET